MKREDMIAEILLTKPNYSPQALDNMTDEQIEREWEHVLDQRTAEQR